MSLLVLGLILFLGVHSAAIVAPGWRAAQVERRGERVWKGGYTLISLLGFVLLIYGYGLARQAPIPVYSPPGALRHLALLLMLPVFPLLFTAYLPGRIKRAAGHPMLLAVQLWAVSHLLTNGMLADVLLFGGFLVWAVACLVSIKHRTASSKAPGAPPGAFNDLIALAGGLAVYGVFLLWVHRWLIGVAPLRG
jgi:uncharacterized membrane protein